MSLTKEQILKASDIKIEKMTVPEWGGDIFVKGMTAKERDYFESKIFEFDPGTKKNRLKVEQMRATIAALTICNEKGERIFTEDEVDELWGKNAGIIWKISELAQKLSAVTEDEMAELEKN